MDRGVLQKGLMRQCVSDTLEHLLKRMPRKTAILRGILHSNRMARDTQMNDTTSLIQYLDTVLLEALDRDTNYVFSYSRDPSDAGRPWGPISEREMISKATRSGDKMGLYMSTMIAKQNENGEYRNRQQDFHALHCIVLDDVGTKADPNALKPTAIIESSAGNYQWQYFFKEPITDRDLATRLVAAVYETDLTDGGGKMVNKYVRVPAGINAKVKDGVQNTFPVRLVELSDVFYTPEELLDGFGLVLGDQPENGQVDPPAVYSAEDYKRVVDPVWEWLNDNGHVLPGGDDRFRNIVCPWHSTHTNGNPIAGYSPLGYGSRPEFRGYNCFHEHEHTTVDFLAWVEEQGGPRADVFDPVGVLVSRYVLLEYSNEVADTWAGAGDMYPIVSLSSFKNAHRQYIVGQRGSKQYYGELWLEHRDTIRCKGRVYDPNGEAIIEGETGKLFNTYRKPRHMPTAGEPTAYLDHIEWLIPDAGERELFHNWIAQKLQHPGSRSYAMVMVAALEEGEEGEQYGTGRSTVGDIIGRVFKTGVAKLKLEDITGKGDSQTAYNDWADGTQLAIVEETKDSSDGWKADYSAYENLKSIVDTRPIPGVRVKPKYGRIYETTLYANFLFFTNHDDALMLPEGDRRFAVISNAKGRRRFDEYAELQKFLRSVKSIAKLYHWYMDRDITQFDHIYPPMTPAKNRMQRLGISSTDEVWKQVLEECPTALATLPYLTRKCADKCIDDPSMEASMRRVVRQKWKRLGEIAPGWRIHVDGEQISPRIIREHESVRLSHRNGEFDCLREIISHK